MRTEGRAHEHEPQDRAQQGDRDARDRRRGIAAAGAAGLQEQRMSEQTLAQEIALVTGASRGIGRAIAIELARRGATVVGTATSAVGAQGITQQLAEAGKVRGIVWNVADAQSIDAALKDIEAHEGTPTVLVNNAGITRDNLLLRMKDEEWNDIVTTNLGSVFRLSKGVLRGMMKVRRGRDISSAAAGDGKGVCV